MVNSNFPDNELLARVLAGEGSADEAAQVEQWAASAPEHQAELARLQSVFAVGDLGGDWDVERALLRTKAAIANESPESVVIPISRGNIWPARIFQLAAAVLIVVGLSWAWKVTANGNGASYLTTAGQRLEVALPDGSLAVLAPNSELMVPRNYNKGTRSVELDGEAWFSVEHDSENPFQVASGNFTVTDLGTVFTIDSRSVGGLIVTVVEGEVRVQELERQSTGQSLLAGDIGRFGAATPDSSAGVMVERDQPVAAQTAWHAGVLSVEEMPVDRVRQRLEEWYGVPIIIADTSLSRQTITASLSLDSLDSALEVLGVLLDKEVVRDSSGVVLR